MSATGTRARSIILGTAGHIDHGKTALVRALTGTDTDRLPQEKERGITIDIGFANLVTEDCSIGIVDVPGHERFIRNMLAGASGIDIVVLVIAADDSVMPQTREHLAILELLQIRHGLIALAKCDLVEPSWLELVEDDVRELTRGTFLENAPIIRTSARTGEGVDALREAITDAATRIGATEGHMPFRLAIDRSFVGQGVGTIVTGTVWSGTLNSGETVELLPAGRPLRVRGVQSHGAVTEQVHAGQRAALNLMGVHHTEVQRGNELATSGYLEPSRLLTVALRALPSAPWPIRHRARLRLHLGTMEVMASVRLLESDLIHPGETGLAQLILAQPTVAIWDQPFVIRAESPVVTLGGGTVLQPTAERVRRRDPEAARHLSELTSADMQTRAAAVLYFAGTRQLNDLAWVRLGGCDVLEVQRIVDGLTESDLAVVVDESDPPQLLHQDVYAQLAHRVERAVKRLHEQSPLESSVLRAEVVRTLDWLADARTLQQVIDRLMRDGVLRGDDRAIALKRHKAQLSARQMDLYSQLIDLYRTAEFAPPDVATASRELSAKEGELRAIIDLCVQAGKLVHIGGPLYMHPDAEQSMRERIAAALADTSGLAMSEIRDLLGTTRKYAVPLCEYLDRIGFTRRVGDVRVLASPAG